MPDFLFASEAARELGEQLQRVVRPRDLSDLFYNRELHDATCPVVGGRRLIPRAYLVVIADHLRRRNKSPRGRKSAS